MGEVSGGVVLAAVMLMLVLAVGQGKWEYFQEMVWNSSFSGRKIMEIVLKKLHFKYLLRTE
jgi:hypothetical protein